MKWSYKLGRYAGIDVYLHVTFLLLLGFLALSAMSAGIGAAILSVAFAVLLFGCVLLHEFGHALAARHYGIGTRDIILLPIGGVARLERMPREPLQELVVALAGPAVNVVIAAALYLLGGIAGALHGPTEGLLAGALVERLLWANVMLVGFNLLPAFPMDGGRVLRSLLAMRKPFAEATDIASQVGKSFAVLFGLFGLFFGNLMLVVLAVFVFMAAGAEAKASRTKAQLEAVRAGDAALISYRCLTTRDSLQDAAEEARLSRQRDFPVLDETGGLAGLLTEPDLVRAYSFHGPFTPVVRVMRRDFPVADPDSPLDLALERLQESGFQSMPLVRAGRLVGLLTLEGAADYLHFGRSMWRPAGSASRVYSRPSFTPPPPPRESRVASVI